MDSRIIKKIKIKADVYSPSSKGKSKKMYAEKDEELKVNTQRDGILYVKGQRDVFPIGINEVEILQYE